MVYVQLHCIWLSGYAALQHPSKTLLSHFLLTSLHVQAAANSRAGTTEASDRTRQHARRRGRRHSMKRRRSRSHEVGRLVPWASLVTRPVSWHLTSAASSSRFVPLLP